MADKKELPAAVDIEKKLLSAMLLRQGKIIPDVASELTAEDFYRIEHQRIFSMIIDAFNEGEAPSFDLIYKKLESQKDKPIDKTYVLSIADYEYTTGRSSAYIKIIKDAAKMREIIYACEEILDYAYDQSSDADYVLELMEKKFLAITTKSIKGVGFESLGVITQRALKNIQYLHNHPDELNGVPTGLSDLDKVINGLHKSDLILLAARPSMGKTALALNIATNAAKKAKKIVALFSLEMSKEQLANRFLSTASQVDSMYLSTGHFSDNDMHKLINSAESMSDTKIFIDDTSGMTIMDIRSRIRSLRIERGLDLIIIDYLQLMQGTRSKYSDQNRQQEISEISRTLKSLARELEVPILALSQLNRTVEQRAEKKPQLSDLRESGSLEQDADMVMFLYRDEYYNRDESDNKNIAELIIAKNRNGPTTSIHVQFQKNIMRFGDLTRVEM